MRKIQKPPIYPRMNTSGSFRVIAHEALIPAYDRTSLLCFSLLYNVLYLSERGKMDTNGLRVRYLGSLVHRRNSLLDNKCGRAVHRISFY